MAKADTDYAIPQGTLIIGGHAFDDCNSLISIAIPDSVISIRNRAFNACGSLTSVSLT